MGLETNKNTTNTVMQEINFFIVVALKKAVLIRERLSKDGLLYKERERFSKESLLCTDVEQIHPRKTHMFYTFAYHLPHGYIVQAILPSLSYH